MKNLFISLVLLSLHSFADVTSPKDSEVLQTSFRYNRMINDLNGEFGLGLSLEEEIKNQEVNAVSIAVIENNKITQYHQYGFLDKEKTKPVTRETTFHVASLSKLVAGLAMAEAERQRILDRRKSVAEYQEEFRISLLSKWIEKNFDERGESYPEEITIRRLMSHTAGLDTHGIGIQVPKNVKSMEEIMLGDSSDSSENGVSPIHYPGTKFDYSGGGYVVAEHILELTTGESYTDWVTRNILDVLEMNQSTLETADNRMTNLASGCSRGTCPVLQRRTEVKSAGGLIATAEDYAKILLAVTNKGKINGAQVLQNSVIEKVLTAASHRNSSFEQCVEKKDCPQRREVCIPYMGCIQASFEQECYQNRCQQLLETSPGSFYGQGVFLSGPYMRDGFHSILSHTGSNVENETTFYFDRSKKRGIVILVAGDVWEKNGISRGTRVLNNEILSSFKRYYIND